MFACLACLAVRAHAQPAETNRILDAAREQSKHSILFPISLLVPDGIREGYGMRDFIASPEFGAFDSANRPEDVFDEIYYTAVAYAHGDPSDALLAAAFGVIEHEYIPIDFFGSELRVALTSESHARFAERWSHLPSHLYHTQEDDRDKLQHFFASAWLKELLGMDWLAKLAGKLVEVGESLFLVGGFEDPRDLHANHDGIRFGVHADGSMEDRPSECLTPNP
jgi:hypothetical protein